MEILPGCLKKQIVVTKMKLPAVILLPSFQNVPGETLPYGTLMTQSKRLRPRGLSDYLISTGIYRMRSRMRTIRKNAYKELISNSAHF